MGKSARSYDKYLKDQKVQRARENYVQQLYRLFDDTPEEKYTLIEEQMTALDNEKTRLVTLAQHAATLPPEIRDKKRELLYKQIACTSLAISELDRRPDNSIEALRISAVPVLAALGEDIEQLKPMYEDAKSKLDTDDRIRIDMAEVALRAEGRSMFDVAGHVASDYVERFYQGSRDDTQERYKEMDFWHSIGMEYEMERPTAQDRFTSISMVPMPIQQAKWEFMVALADKAYNITGNLDSEIKSEFKVPLIASLLSKLSMHERGSSNVHMPYTHKMRHNPAIHSLHVVALVDKVFHYAYKKIMEDGTRDKKNLLGKWQHMRDDAMMTAIVHDMGELDGELSQGVDRAFMKPEQIVRLQEAVDANERTTYENHLNRQRTTALELTNDEWQNLKKQYMEYFDTVGNKTFLGKMLKVLERMQSQHDYLRFDGLSAAPKLIDTTPANLTFSMNYIPAVLRDAPYTQEKIGPKALRNFIPQAGSTVRGSDEEDKAAICTYLCEATEEEFRHLMKKQAVAYGVDIKDVAGLKPSNGRSLAGNGAH
jgi:hypothetical protein